MSTDVKSRDSFVFHRDWFDVISKRDDTTRLEVYDAIMNKVFNNSDLALSDLASVVMDFVMPQIHRDTQKWIDIREKRSKAGAKHNGNQYIAKVEQNGTNGTSVPFDKQNGTNGTVSVSVSVDNISKDNVILKEKEDKSSTKKSSTRFVKPTIEEVSDYITEKGYHVDAENFINYYESKGWLVGKSPMKNWKAAVKTWEKTWKDSHPAQMQQEMFPVDTDNNPYPQGYWQ